MTGPCRSCSWTCRSRRMAVPLGVLLLLGTSLALTDSENLEIIRQDRVRRDASVAGEQARAWNLATKVMSNGVEVIVATDKSTLPGEPEVLRVLPSSPITLAPSTLTDHMMLLMPSQVELDSAQFVTRTYVTTYTLVETSTSQEHVVSNVATEQVDPAGATSTPQSSVGVTVTASPVLSTAVYHTTYTYLNTLLDGEVPLVLTSRRTVANTVTAPGELLSTLPAADALATNTYLSTVQLTRTLSDGDQLKVVSTQDVLTRVVITESQQQAQLVTHAPASTPSELDMTTTEVVKTYLVTYTYYSTYLEGESTVVHSDVAVSTDITTETFLKKPKRTSALRLETTTSVVEPTPTPPEASPSLSPTRAPVAQEEKLPGIHVVATKTYLTTFTYFTTLLQGSMPAVSTVVSSRTRVVQNVVTESVATSLLHPDYVQRLRSSFRADPALDSSRIVATATLQGGQQMEITAMVDSPANLAALAAAASSSSMLADAEAVASTVATPALASVMSPDKALLSSLVSSAASAIMGQSAASAPASGAASANRGSSSPAAPAAPASPVNDKVITGSTIIFFDDPEPADKPSSSSAVKTSTHKHHSSSDGGVTKPSRTHRPPSKTHKHKVKPSTSTKEKPSASAALGHTYRTSILSSRTVTAHGATLQAGEQVVVLSRPDGSEAVIPVGPTSATDSATNKRPSGEKVGEVAEPSSNLGMSDLLQLGSIGINGINALRPVFSAMAGLLSPAKEEIPAKQPLVLVHKLPAVSGPHGPPVGLHAPPAPGPAPAGLPLSPFQKPPPPGPVAAAGPPPTSPAPVLEQNPLLSYAGPQPPPPERLVAASSNNPQRNPIYIPVGAGAGHPKDAIAEESQRIEGNTKLNAVWPDAEQRLKLAQQAQAQQAQDGASGVVLGRPTLESPLLAGGIPIQPGQVITANSDVIIGKPSVHGPRPPKRPPTPADHTPIGMKPPPPPPPPQATWPEHDRLPEDTVEHDPLDEHHEQPVPAATGVDEPHEQFGEHIANLLPPPAPPATPLREERPSGGPAIPLGHSHHHHHNHHHKIAEILDMSPPANQPTVVHAPSDDIALRPPPPPHQQQHQQHQQQHLQHHPQDQLHPHLQHQLHPHAQHEAQLHQQHVDLPMLTVVGSHSPAPLGLGDFGPSPTQVSVIPQGQTMFLGRPVGQKMNVDQQHLTPDTITVPIILPGNPQVVERASGQPLLVNIQPSQVANVLIPHGSSTALIYSGDTLEHGKKGEYFDDPLPYPDPDTAHSGPVAVGPLGVPKPSSAIRMDVPIPPEGIQVQISAGNAVQGPSVHGPPSAPPPSHGPSIPLHNEVPVQHHVIHHHQNDQAGQGFPGQSSHHHHGHHPFNNFPNVHVNEVPHRGGYHDPAHAQQQHEQNIREQQLQEHNIREQQLQEQRIREQQLQEQHIREQQLQEQRLREQQQQEHHLREQQLQEQLREQQQHEQRLREQQQHEQRLREQQQQDQLLREQQLHEQHLREQQLQQKLLQQIQHHQQPSLDEPVDYMVPPPAPSHHGRPRPQGRPQPQSQAPHRVPPPLPDQDNEQDGGPEENEPIESEGGELIQESNARPLRPGQVPIELEVANQAKTTERTPIFIPHAPALGPAPPPHHPHHGHRHYPVPPGPRPHEPFRFERPGPADPKPMNFDIESPIKSTIIYEQRPDSNRLEPADPGLPKTAFILPRPSSKPSAVPKPPPPPPPPKPSPTPIPFPKPTLPPTTTPAAPVTTPSKSDGGAGYGDTPPPAPPVSPTFAATATNKPPKSRPDRRPSGPGDRTSHDDQVLGMAPPTLPPTTTTSRPHRRPTHRKPRPPPPYKFEMPPPPADTMQPPTEQPPPPPTSTRPQPPTQPPASSSAPSEGRPFNRPPVLEMAKPFPTITLPGSQAGETVQHEVTWSEPPRRYTTTTTTSTTTTTPVPTTSSTTRRPTAPFIRPLRPFTKPPRLSPPRDAPAPNIVPTPPQPAPTSTLAQLTPLDIAPTTTRGRPPPSNRWTASPIADTIAASEPTVPGVVPSSISTPLDNFSGKSSAQPTRVYLTRHSGSTNRFTRPTTTERFTPSPTKDSNSHTRYASPPYRAPPRRPQPADEELPAPSPAPTPAPAPAAVPAPQPTRYITRTETIVLTTTETSVLRGSEGQQPSTQTVVLTSTMTSTRVDTVTQTETLVKPTSVFETVTTTVSHTTTHIHTQTAEPSVLPTIIPPWAVSPTPYPENESIDVHVSSSASGHPTGASEDGGESDGEDDDIITHPQDGEDSIFLVMTDHKPGTVQVHKLPPPSLEDEPTNADETNEVKNNAVLLGGVLVASPPGVRPAGVVVDEEDPDDEHLAVQCRPECSATRNELCQRQHGLMRCVCRPGFARMFPDQPCKPTYTYSMRLALDRHGGERVRFAEWLSDPASPRFARLAEATKEGLERVVMQSELRDVAHGVVLQGFAPAGQHDNDHAVVNFYVQLSDNTDELRLKDVFRKSLRATNFSLGGTEVFAAREMLPELDAADFDECEADAGDPAATARFHDCSEHARCFNLRGTYTCSCKEGYTDVSENPQFPGRACSAEQVGCEQCHYHGTCFSRGPGERPVCECFQWYTGQNCHINLKVLLIALGTLGAVLLLLLVLCCVMACARRHSRYSRAGRPQPPPGFLRYRGPSHRDHDTRAMIQDTSSEGSVDNLPPYVTAMHQPMHTMSAKHKKGAGKKVSVPHELVVERADCGSALGSPAGTMEQRDRSLTVMIPRAKYRAASTSGPAPLTSLSTFTGELSREHDPQHKLLAYLEGPSSGACPQQGPQGSQGAQAVPQAAAGVQQGAGRKQSAQSGAGPAPPPPPSHRKGPAPRKPSATGALVSAGFEVSATVGRHIRPGPHTLDVDEDVSSRDGDDMSSHHPHYHADHHHHDHRYDTQRTRVGDRTVSEARSCDETTIQPPTKCIHSHVSNYASSKPSSHSNHNNNDESHTMVERDLGSTFLMPQTHLYQPDRGSDISNFDSL